MKRIRIILFYFLTSLAVLIFISNSSVAISSIGAENGICFHKAIINANTKSILGYEKAENLFPGYELPYWPSNTLIKTSPDLTFYKSDIRSIVIARPPYVPADSLSLNITIKFEKLAAKNLSDFSSKNISKYTAVTLGGKLQSIAMVHNKIDGEMILTSVEESVEELKHKFSILSDNVIFKDMHEE